MLEFSGLIYRDLPLKTSISPTDIAERADQLAQQILDSQLLLGTYQSEVFYALLCTLIRELPEEWVSVTRQLCKLSEASPKDIVRTLRVDLTRTLQDSERQAVYHPLLRAALNMRSSEILGPR